MSLEQYKDATRKELWEILQIQVERIAELESVNSTLHKLMVSGEKKGVDKATQDFEHKIAELEKYNSDLVAEQVVSEILKDERIAELEDALLESEGNCRDLISTCERRGSKIKELEKELGFTYEKTIKDIKAHNIEQQKISIQNATAKVDTHRPFRPISRYEGDVEIDADMWRKAYKKGYDDALVEVKHEGVKLREQAEVLRDE